VLKKEGHASKYTQVKVSVEVLTASSFKKACQARNVSMASVISQHMEQFCGDNSQKADYSPDLSTRRQRRAVVRSIARQLERVRDNEEQYMLNIPENLQGGTAFDNAEQCISTLEEVLDLLNSAY
jgi:hypothetical protein